MVRATWPCRQSAGSRGSADQFDVYSPRPGLPPFQELPMMTENPRTAEPPHIASKESAER
jgi:hypothetical protein